MTMGYRRRSLTDATLTMRSLSRESVTATIGISVARGGKNNTISRGVELQLARLRHRPKNRGGTSLVTPVARPQDEDEIRFNT
ncbi:MAG: hypothetical protein ACI8QS_001719 [Planctomycetota bacterium]|jgi:hypothetical protein